MRGITKFAVVGALAVCMTGAAALAAGSGKATVGDLVKAIATKKGVSVVTVQGTLEAKSGRRINLDATLDQGLAASLLADLGVPVQASRRSEMTMEDVNKLGSLLTLARVSAEDGDGDDDGGDGRDGGEVVNRGRKTRPFGQTPNSNADINAFESLDEDQRD